MYEGRENIEQMDRRREDKDRDTKEIEEERRGHGARFTLAA